MKALTPRQYADLTLGFGIVLIVRGALDGWTSMGLTAAGVVLLAVGGIWRARLRGL